MLLSNTHLLGKPIPSISTSITHRPKNRPTKVTKHRHLPPTRAKPTPTNEIKPRPTTTTTTKAFSTSAPSNKTFWGAVGLIVGTAVGPGMLGLPSSTLRSGPLPSSLAILLSSAYVLSSVLLVAELTFAAMENSGAGDGEVTFTALATDAFGPAVGAFVAVVYASLSFALLVACVSGVGSLVVQSFPMVGAFVAHAALPCFVGALIGFLPFQAVDGTNRVFCAFMVLSIAALVAVGMSVGKTRILNSLAFASWSVPSILPAIPVTVLTLGFHVVTPFMCKIVGNSPLDARKAILLGGSVPLAMVLAWNLVVLGLSGSSPPSPAAADPIKLLLNVSPSALPAVRGFAFAALTTSLIGYSLSFPKQLVDTVQLLIMNPKSSTSDSSATSNNGSRDVLVMWAVLGSALCIAYFYKTAFSRALEFAGVYANCFLFGILPPAMAWLHRSRRALRSYNKREADLLPGGNASLFLLFVTAVLLFIWH